MVAQVSEADPTAVIGTSLGLGIDLGRHRSYAAASTHSTSQPIALSRQADGLLIRWVGDGGPQRVTERIVGLAGQNQPAAISFVGLVADQILRGVPSSIHGENSEPSLVQAVAIPSSFGPQCRRAVLDGFERAGVYLEAGNLVERPIAALAGWIAHRNLISGHPPREPVLVIDNDGGELSAVVADPLTRRLLACMPLSTGPDDNPTLVVDRLRALISASATMLHREGIIQETDWPSVSATLPQVVVTGSGQAHPEVTALIHRLLPAADVMPDPLISNPAHCVVLGLQHLDQLAGWRACWPTTDIRIVDPECSTDEIEWDKAAVIVERGQALPRIEDAVIVRPGAKLVFGTPGRPLRLRSGSMVASSLEIPPAIGPLPLLRIQPDGRLSIRGPQGVRPLTVHLSWPCPGTPASEMKLSTIGRRVASLV